jgi:glutamate-1-semialdehyde 2,1-aminomutase
MNYSKRLNKIIPGGCHTYSRGDDQFPENCPQILTKGLGSSVWSDNKKYIDYGMGLRSITIGYADPRVNQAAIDQINLGNNLTRASMIELEAAEKMVDTISGADMVKFAKNGSNVTTAAVKLARAYTGRKYIARCSQHPFFSFDDWFIGNTEIKKGVPNEIQKLTLSFNYNDTDSVEQLFSIHGDNIAAIILEPMTTEPPCQTKYGNFLQFLRKIADKHGSLLILDEMITGFRWHMSGAQNVFDVIPDLSTFGKGMANGFSLAALCGKREIMSLGGIKEKNLERTFLLSSTHGAEMSSLGAFVKTLEIYREEDVIGHIWRYGGELKREVNLISRELGLIDYFYLTGQACSPSYATKDKNLKNCLKMRTIFNSAMIENGILIPWIAISLSHGHLEMEMTLSAIRKSLKVYAAALENPESFITGNVIQPVFRKYN